MPVSFGSCQRAAVRAGGCEAGRFRRGGAAHGHPDQEKHVCGNSVLDGSRGHQTVCLWLQGVEILPKLRNGFSLKCKGTVWSFRRSMRCQNINGQMCPQSCENTRSALWQKGRGGKMELLAFKVVHCLDIVKQDKMLVWKDKSFVCVFAAGRHLVFGNHSNRTGKRRAPQLGPAPDASVVSYTQESSPHTGGLL